jgi:hypothetical protein
MKNFRDLSVLFLLLFGIGACQDDEQPMEESESQEQVTLESTARSDNGNDPQARKVVGAFFVSEFEVGTKDVEMKYASQADLAAGISLGGISLKSNINTSFGNSASTPKRLVLIANGESRVELVGEGDSPEGKYTEVELTLYKNSEISSDEPMHEKSLLIRGEVQGTPTWVWMDAEKQLKAEAQEEEGIEVENETEMMLVFDMVELFKNVDFETAVDANGDGRIEIGPNDVDGNVELYSQIEANLESAVKLEKK